MKYQKFWKNGTPTTIQLPGEKEERMVCNPEHKKHCKGYYLGLCFAPGWPNYDKCTCNEEPKEEKP